MLIRFVIDAEGVLRFALGEPEFLFLYAIAVEVCKTPTHSTALRVSADTSQHVISNFLFSEDVSSTPLLWCGVLEFHATQFRFSGLMLDGWPQDSSNPGPVGQFFKL